MMGARLLLLLLLAAAATTGEDSDLVFENEDPRRLLDNELEYISEEEPGLGGRLQRFKSQIFGSLLDFNVFSSSSPPSVTTESSASVRRKAEDLFYGNREIDLEPRNDHRRLRRAIPGDDEDEGSSFGSGAEDNNSNPIYTPGKELTIRVSFVVREPYQVQFDNRDSVPFQNLSRNLADGVNELFDTFPGEQRARLVRIQSRPEDNFTCKVTLELQTVNEYDTKKIQDFLKRHISETGRLGKVTVSADEFSYKQFGEVVEPTNECALGEQQCRNGECVDASKRCNGFPDCSDASDEVGCDTDRLDINEIDTAELGTDPPTTEVTDSTPQSPIRGDQEITTEDDYEDFTTVKYTTETTESAETTDTPESPEYYPTDETPKEPITEDSRGETSPPERPTSYPDTEAPRCSPEDQITCYDSSEYICRSQWCDGIPDCPDADDESDCGETEPDCQKDEMVCDVTRCVPSTKRCDGIPDCIDGADERDCGARCESDDFICADGKCLEGFRQCNKVMDCVGGEDERGCPCLADEFRCGDNACIERRKVCDGVRNCVDNSDEADCPSEGRNGSWSGVHVCVKQGQFMCGDGTCLSVLHRCDGVTNCPKDASDETDCPCTPDQWQCDFGSCIAKAKRCDGHVDCPSDRSDERNCIVRCTYDEFQCGDGNCIPKGLMCDARYDCTDLSDEKNCPCPDSSDFMCRTGVCIKGSLRCDRLSHCTDSSDEIGCTAKSDSKLSAVETHFHPLRCRKVGPRRCMPVSLCEERNDRNSESGSWKCQCGDHEFKCSDGSCIDRRSLCNGIRECPKGEDENCAYRGNDIPEVWKLKPTCAAGTFRCRTAPYCVSNQYKCDGIKQCPFGDDEEDCRPPPCDIQCGDGTCVDNSKRCDLVADCNDQADERDCGPCTDNEFRCDSGLCVPENRRCDGVSDCDDESDELGCQATAPPSTCSDSVWCDDGCLDPALLCDGREDCSTGDDEIDCPKATGCLSSEYECEDRTCIDFSRVCDGNPDCSDGNDEVDCDGGLGGSCSESQFACDTGGCVPHIQRCDNVYDCRDFSDEQNCFNSGCQPSEWQCTSGDCVDKSALCNGFSDCPDGSDERLPSCYVTTPPPAATNPPYTRRPPYTRPPPPPAPEVTTGYPWGPIDERCRHDEWRCENGPCILTSLRCNGKADCPYDNSDELDCPNVSPDRGLNLKTYPNDQIIRQSGEVVFQCRDEGSIRAPVKWVREGGRSLPVGSLDRNGRLEMPNIQVSDSGIYICQAVGYPRYTPGSELSVRLTVEPYSVNDVTRPQEACKLNEATCSNGECIPKSNVCNGRYDCTDGSDEIACNVHGLCEPNEFKCANKRCILKTWLCDSEDDCKDGSDEQSCDQGPDGAACRPHEYQCRSGSQCVPRSFHCDGEKDCLDGSDEVGCSPVYISRHPPPLMILSEYSTLVITCMAVGVPTPQVVWRLNWGHIPSKCSYTSVNGLGTLTCPNVQNEDQGAYSCEALNNRGSVFAVPDTILVINGTKSGVCPAGFFNSEARVAQDCISCFCFGATSDCKSADLFTYQLPPPLNRGGSHLAGVTQPTGQPLQITDEPISDIFEYTPEYNGATITRIGQWSPRNIYPYLALPESYHGSQLKSYGGYIKYTVTPHGAHPLPSGYSPLPDIVIKGAGGTLLTHSIPGTMRVNQDNNVSVRLFQGQWKKVTAYGPQDASREDIMMVLATIEAVLLRGEISGSGVDIKNFQMDSAGASNSGQGSASFVEECACPQGHSGLSCQKCSPGYSRSDSGQLLGRCVREEVPCQPGYYGNPSGGVACRLCPCPLTNPSNQFSRTCRLESDGQVTCNCPIGYQGRRCETCSSGYIGNPTVPGDSCRVAPPPSDRCDFRGTASQDGNNCRCKPNVVGSRCNECAPEAFDLSIENMFGCSQCFCMGVTRSCSSSQWRYSPVSAKFGSQSSAQSVKLLEWDGQLATSRAFGADALSTDLVKQEITFNRFDVSKPNTYYWSLPDRFSGDKISAYGGYFNYNIRHVAGNGPASANNDPDVQLISKNGLYLRHYNGATPGEDGYINETVQLLEQYWQRSDGQPMGREHMLMALADVESILVKATYAAGTERASLVSASLQVANDRGSGNRASHVEVCTCPQGYLGTSCQDCAPGYTRSMEGLYLGLCELCSCNGHADQCHPETGECLNCQHNTEGQSCENCSSGYEGDATLGNPDSCMPGKENQLQCRCDYRGTQAPFCVGGSTTCRCKPNVEGERCDQCRSGSFKLSEANPWGCAQCFCSGVSVQCDEANHLYRQQIPTAIFDDSHGFTLTTLDQRTVIDSNFQLNVSMNQISYGFDGRVQTNRLFWSLPSTFTGNKVTSYGGQITVTQKFDVARGRDEYSNNDDYNVLLVGGGYTIFWKNPNRLRSGIPLTYSVTLTEDGWNTISPGEAPRPVSRSDFLSILADLHQVLVRATLADQLTHTYIADVAMDIAVPAETGQPLAYNIEVCRCPVGYIGTSCETCTTGYYRSKAGRCERCPCSGHEEGCRLGSRDVICDCRPGYTGVDCSRIDYRNTTHVTSQRPPAIIPTIQVVIAAPTVENKPVGGSVQFICSARSSYSSSPLRATWSKERGTLPLGRFIEDASRGVLTIRDLKITDSGTYICQANDGISSAIDRATLTVPRNEVVPPQVSIPSAFLEVYEGEPIEMRCDVAGIPTPDVIWSRVNRKPLNFQHTFVDGVFRISQARQSDQGEYKCIANNAGGQDSKVAVIYVNPRPESQPRQPILSVRPASPVVKEGDSLTLVCAAEPSVPSNYITWTRDEGYLPPNSHSANGQLRLEGVRPEDAGVYRCSADSAPQRVVPASVVVTVQRAPRPPLVPGTVVVDRRRSTVPEGQSLTVKCDPRGSSPLPIIKWTKSGGEFGPGVVQRGNALVISQAKLSDRGVYVCVGSTLDGETIAQDSAIIEIERREAPTVSVWPEGVQAVRLGSSVRLQCRVYSGAPEPVLTWSRPSGRPLSTNTHLLPDGVLSFSSISVNEEGVYTCTGSNLAGEGSANATIKIHSPPVLTIYPDSVITVVPGREVVIECRASGYPEPIAHWVMVSPEEKTIGSESSGVAILTLPSVEETDEGTYACVARNDAGIQEERVQVTVQDNDIDSEPVRGDISGPVAPKVTISTGKGIQQARVGDTLRVSCKGTRNINRIVWTKANTRLYLNTESQPGGSVLVLNNLGLQDSGVYRCEGYDNNGVSTVDEFTLRVIAESVPNYVPSYVPSYVPTIPPRIIENDRENDWQQDSPKVYSAKLGSMVRMPCVTTLPTPVLFEWERPHAILPRSVQARSPELVLTSISESDAGPYVCHVSHKNLKMESRVILKVTHVVPRFSGDGFLALNKLKDAYFHFDIVIVIKPQDYNGIILYNSEKTGPSGDMVSLALVEGIPEFRYILGSGSAVVIRGDTPLTLDEWHTIKIIRSRKDGYMYVDGKGPFSGTSTSKHLGLDLLEPLYIGGVPDYNQLPEDFQPRTGFVGCVGRLVLESSEISLLREALETQRADQCDSCTQNSCRNGAVCQEALTERGYSCLCAEGYSGLDCSRTGDACHPGLCGRGRCKDTEDGFSCICPVGFAGKRCETSIDVEYPAFGGKSFLAFATPKNSYALKMSLKLKPNYPLKDGIILYCAESRHGHGDFTSLAMKNGFLEFRFDSGTGPVVIKSRKPLVPNEWVTVNIARMMNQGKLSVEGQEPVTGNLRGKKVLNLMTPLYIGGYDSELLTINKGTGVEDGFDGCVGDVKISEVKLDIKSSPVKSANILECRNASEPYTANPIPRRGDISEANTPYPEYEGICGWCQNGGYCAQAGDTQCICLSGFRGQRCETTVPTAPQSSPCELQPCENGGICRPTRQATMYQCDCPKGTGGFQCKQLFELSEDVSLTGEGYVELPSSLLDHNDPTAEEFFAIAFTTSSPDGLLVLQKEEDANLREGDFIMLSVNGGYVELQWELGGGVGTIQNTRVPVSDNQRHTVVVKRTALEATLEVDGKEDHGKAPGMTQILNADSNIYVGGIPSAMTNTGLIGFSGCIHQIEFRDSLAINFGRTAVASRNANSCSSY